MRITLPMNTKPSIIAIDGPAASGKSTVAEIAANRLGYLFFDTGIMYRAVTLAALRTFGSVDDEEAVNELTRRVEIDARPPSIDDGRKYDVLLDGEDVTWDIRLPEVNQYVSPVSAYPVVRDEMTRQQRRIGERGRSIIVGRDIGTVVFPDADLKIYLDASAEERARRRYLEIINRGEDADVKDILAGIKRRDRIDSTRDVAPLKPADDAVIIQTDDLDIEEVVRVLLDYIGRV